LKEISMLELMGGFSYSYTHSMDIARTKWIARRAEPRERPGEALKNNAPQ
jgi:hypothetical protein